MTDQEKALYAETIADIEADRCNLKARVEALEAERDAWREAAQYLTPKGSEFTSPRSCIDFLRAERDASHDVKCDVVRRRREAATLRARNAELLEALALMLDTGTAGTAPEWVSAKSKARALIGQESAE